MKRAALRRGERGILSQYFLLVETPWNTLCRDLAAIWWKATARPEVVRLTREEVVLRNEGGKRLYVHKEDNECWECGWSGENGDAGERSILSLSFISSRRIYIAIFTDKTFVKFDAKKVIVRRNVIDLHECVHRRRERKIKTSDFVLFMRIVNPAEERNLFSPSHFVIKMQSVEKRFWILLSWVDTYSDLRFNILHSTFPFE